MVAIGNLGLGILALSVYLIKTLTLQYFLHQIIVYLYGILLKFRALLWTFQWSNPYTQFFIQWQHNDLENILGFTCFKRKQHCLLAEYTWISLFPKKVLKYCYDGVG